MTAHLIRARRLYQSYSEPAVIDATILVDGSRLTYAGPTESAPPADPGARVIDLGDRTLGPGLIDSHVHLHFDGGDDPVSSLAAHDDDLAARADAAARGLLSAGVTTARDLGTRVVGGPSADLPLDLHRAGVPLTSPRGHCWFMGGEAATLRDALTVVDRAVESGCDWLKVMMSGGFLTGDTVIEEPQLSLRDARAVVKHAHESGLKVSAHAHGALAILRSALVGVDTIEHATFLGPAESEEPDVELVQAVLDSGAAICPTANSATGTYPEETGRRALRRTVRAAAQGLPLIVGTDAGVRHVQTSSYAASLAELRRAGLSSNDALVAATTGAARALGLEGITGAVRSGLRADLVAFDRDPVTYPAGLARPSWVMAQGTVIDGGGKR